MKRRALCILSLVGVGVVLAGLGVYQPGAGQPDALLEATGGMRFLAVEVRVDPQGSPLAGYQVEVVAPGASLVGVEGGTVSVFAEPPHYDPKALHASPGHERVVLAALAGDGPLPEAESVVAILHYAVPASVELAPRCTLIAAGDASAARLNARCSAGVLPEVTTEGVEP